MPPFNSNTPSVRTFEQDVAESMQNKQASVLHVALAEQEREKEIFVETKKRRGNVFLYILAFLFIVSAFGLIFYAYFFYTPTQTVTIPPNLVETSDLVLSDETISVEVDVQNRIKSLALLTATSGIDTTLGVVTRVVPYVLETNTDGTKKSRGITSSEFFAFIGTNVPDIFKRALSSDFSFVRVVDDGMRAGIIVQTNDYERTIVGLTDWEKTMLSDLEKLFGYTRRIEIKELVETITQKEVVKTTPVYDPKTKKTKLVTAATTEPVSTFEEKVRLVNDDTVFTNDIRKNIELRIAKGGSGKEYLVYGFPRRNTLIIAGSVDVFLRLVDRLPKTN